MLKKIIPLVERLFSLLVVFLMLSATTMWSGKFIGRDWLTVSNMGSGVSQVVTKPDSAVLSQLGLNGMNLSPRDSVSWNVISPEKEMRGVVVSSVFAENIIGYAGATPLLVYIDNEQKVQAVVAQENDETPGFFIRAAKGILHQWDKLTVDDAIELQVDAVTGATYTSNSLIGNMKAALSAYAATEVTQYSEPAIGWVRTVALFVVFACGLVAAWRFRGNKKVRLLVMILNVAVTGFWCGQFLSFSFFHGWIQNGANVLLYLPTVVMLVIALVMPYFGKKNHYCMWMCPYGSLQELAWQLPLLKVKVGAKIYKWMRHIRMFVLMLLLASLWMGFGFSVMDYEPFSAFIVATASPAVMILAGAFVVLGIFIPHPWCQCVCPVGMLLNLAEEKK